MCLRRWLIAVLAAALPCVAQPTRAGFRRVLETTNLTLQFQPNRGSGLSFSVWRWPFPGMGIGRLGSYRKSIFTWVGPWGKTPETSEMSGDCYAGADGVRVALGFFDDIRGTPLGVFAVAGKGYEPAWGAGGCAPSRMVGAFIQTAAGLKLGLAQRKLVALFGEPTSRSGDRLTWRWPWPCVERDYNGEPFRVKGGRMTVVLAEGRVVYFEVSGADNVGPE